MSGDLQAKRKNKNRSKKKNQLHELERKEHFEESLNKFSTEDIGVENVSTKNKNASRPSKRRPQVDVSETEDTDVTVDDDDFSQTRKVRSKVGILTKFLFFSVIVGFFAVAGFSGDEYKKIPETFKSWGSNCVLPDFQGLQANLNLDSVTKTFETLKESAETSIIVPAQNFFRFLLHFVNGEQHSEEEVHANDDSNDYPSELNDWIQSSKRAEQIIEEPQRQHEQPQQVVEQPQQPQEVLPEVVKEQVPQQPEPQQQQPVIETEDRAVKEEVPQQVLPTLDGVLVDQVSQPTLDPASTPEAPSTEEPNNLPDMSLDLESSKDPESEKQEVEEPKIVKMTAYTLGQN